MQKRTNNGLRLGEGCLTDTQFSHGILMATFAKPLLYAGCGLWKQNLI